MTANDIANIKLDPRNSAAARASMARRIEAMCHAVTGSRKALVIPPKDALDRGAFGSASDACIPEVDAGDLNLDTLRTALTDHGSLIVRDLFPAETAAALCGAIDQVLLGCAQQQTPPVAPPQQDYCDPPAILQEVMPGPELVRSRAFHRDSGSAMCAEAPVLAEALLTMYSELGLHELLTGYFDEAPCLSVKKWVLRRSRLPIAKNGWHQDGAFMGSDINSVNLWLPLTHCGGATGAPGMDVVPRRLHGIVSAQDAQFEWSVSPERVDSGFGSANILSPVFNPGDAFLFDHFYLHRTQYGDNFNIPRYAIETWFFGCSRCPKNQVPARW